MSLAIFLTLHQACLIADFNEIGMTRHTLIKPTGKPSAGYVHEAWEPLFLDWGSQVTPVLPATGMSERYFNYLHQHVSGNPRDLLSHVRRILLALSDNRPALVYEALTDLFVTLGDKGADLRSGLLDKCRHTLTPEQVQALRAHAEPRQHCACLLLVRNRQERPDLKANILDETRELIENGQVELAQQLLEQALPHSPDDLEMTRELLEIYRRSRNSDAAQRTLATLGALRPETRSLWDALLDAPT